jgi:hypothetical protein
MDEYYFENNKSNLIMQIIAKLIQIKSPQMGMSKNGTWKKQDIIVESNEQFPKKICISIWGDKMNENQFKIGNDLKIDFDIESREYNEKWYTDLKAWKIEIISNNLVDNTPMNSDQIKNTTFGSTFSNNDDDDVLPF